MIRKLLTFIAALYLTYSSHAQSTRPVPALIRHLIGLDSTVVPGISWFVRGLVPEHLIPSAQRAESQYLARTKAGLFVKISGSGLLFKVSEGTKGLIFTRVDSTIYQGSDFHAFVFSLGDTVFAFGGYGFWRNNGVLKFLNPKNHDWSSIPLDRELEASAGDNTGFWLDAPNRNLYIGNRYLFNDGVKSRMNRKDPPDSILWKLDLTRGKSVMLGKVTKNFKPGINSPWGLISDDDTANLHFLVHDILQNRTYRFRYPVQAAFRSIYERTNSEIWYFKDSTLYMGNLTLNTFDSLKLSRSDLEYTGQNVYIAVPETQNISPETGNKTTALIYIAFALAGVMLAFRFIGQTQKSDQKTLETVITAPTSSDSAPSPEIAVDRPHNLASIFHPTELSLILHVATKTGKGEFTVLDDVNRILGLANKQETIQKKNRSEVITSINRKWALYNGVDTQLIQRRRSEFDGRYFEYFLDHEALDTFSGPKSGHIQ